MRLELEEPEEDPGLNLVPMIDTVFNLLVFFLVATTFASQEVELDLKLPAAKSGQQGKGNHQLVISVFADGHISLEGRQVTIEALRQKLQAAAVRDKEQAVLVRGDKVAHFGVGLQVLDAIRLARLSKVDFAALPESERN